MGKILLRIYQFADSQDLSLREIERAIGASNGSISGAIKNNREIGSDKIEDILQNYEMLSAEWLLRGEGEMIKSLAPQNDNSALLSTIVQLSAEIERLKAQLKSESKGESSQDI
ncbi:MAG: hypothetical protein J6U51_06840 [Bacteroidales bacterium]|nr:hypothetical protein [Bacteroidales bacterium]